MKEYFKPYKIIADYLYFYFREYKYSGKGLIKWVPKSGFELDIMFTQPRIRSSSIEFRSFKIPEKSDYSSIRAWTDCLGWVLIPDINFSRLEMELISSHISLRFQRIIACENDHYLTRGESWWGTSLYRIKSSSRFQDAVEISTSIKGEVIRLEGKNGFFYEEDETRLVGYFIESEYFYLSWKLSKTKYSKTKAWNWSLGFQNALSIWLGENCQLLIREMRRDGKKIRETRSEEDIINLDYLSLFGNANVQNKVILDLADFFCEIRTEKSVCNLIFEQLLEASKQVTQSSQELLVATILEAAMRTLYNYPTNRQDSSRGLVANTLKSKFKADYLSNDWRKPCNQAIDAFNRLRTRNAHPDWFSDLGRTESVQEKSQALDDLIFLCRFYGYMILALSGFKNLKPDFPESYQNWGPTAFVYSEPNNSVPEELYSFPKFSQGDSRYSRMMIMRRFFMERSRNYFSSN